MARVGGEGREILRGEFGDFGVVGLLRLVRSEALCGRIEIAGLGTIELDSGQVVAAECGRLRGRPALREILFRAAGRFSVIRGAPSGGEPFGDIEVDFIDAARHRDEWARLRAKVLRRAIDPGAAASPEVAAVLAALDGSRTTEAAVAATVGAASLVLDGILAAMSRREVVEVRAPRRATVRDDEEAPSLDVAEPPAPSATAEAAATAAPADPEALIEEGRGRMRAGDLDGAEALLLQALALRPGDRVLQQNLRRIAELREGLRARGARG